MRAHTAAAACMAIVNTLLSAHEPAGHQPTPLELLMRMCRRRREVIAIVAKMAEHQQPDGP